MLKMSEKYIFFKFKLKRKGINIRDLCDTFSCIMQFTFDYSKNINRGYQISVGLILNLFNEFNKFSNELALL